MWCSVDVLSWCDVFDVRCYMLYIIYYTYTIIIYTIIIYYYTYYILYYYYYYILYLILYFSFPPSYLLSSSSLPLTYLPSFPSSLPFLIQSIRVGIWISLFIFSSDLSSALFFSSVPPSILPFLPFPSSPLLFHLSFLFHI